MKRHVSFFFSPKKVKKVTLYRVGSNSPIVAHLLEAAQNEIEVTVLVELKGKMQSLGMFSSQSLQQLGSMKRVTSCGQRRWSRLECMSCMESRCLKLTPSSVW